MKIEAKCPACGCHGSVYVHNQTHKLKVCCEADDANNHDLDYINDWCPESCQTDWYDTEEQAVQAWNDGKILRTP